MLWCVVLLIFLMLLVWMYFCRFVMWGCGVGMIFVRYGIIGIILVIVNSSDGLLFIREVEGMMRWLFFLK